MPHQSLYRRYRPASFEDVVGQDHITGALSEQLKNKQVGHAYLFAGSRGLGKTSVARIFARELGAGERDVYEIDAASHNSVDDIRELTENVYTLPFESPYKVYILDEAHMLSKGAWNAFLKTLEEPPPYAIFILATTELSKIPDTVQSRCQVYEFKKPTRAALARLVSAVARKEKRQIEPGATELIALLGDGSYRDALSILEKVFAAAGTTITREDAERITGAPKGELVEGFVAALSEGNADSALRTIRTAEEGNVDMALYLALVLEEVRMVLLVRYAPELRSELANELGSDAYAVVEALAKEKSSKLTHQTLRVFLDAAERLRFSPVPALPLELAVFELVGQHGT